MNCCKSCCDDESDDGLSDVLPWNITWGVIAAMEFGRTARCCHGASMEDRRTVVLQWSFAAPRSAAMEHRRGAICASMELKWSIDRAAMQRGWCCDSRFSPAAELQCSVGGAVTHGSRWRRSCNADVVLRPAHLVGGRSFNAIVSFLLWRRWPICYKATMVHGQCGRLQHEKGGRQAKDWCCAAETTESNSTKLRSWSYLSNQTAA